MSVLPELIRVAVVDDHEAVRAGLERVLRGRAGLELVAAHADDRELLSLLGQRRVDVVVLDHDLGAADGLELCLRTKQRMSPPAVAVYSGYSGPGVAVAAAAAGADALLNKADPVDGLLDAIERLAAGRCKPLEPSAELRTIAATRVHSEDLAVMSLLFERLRVAEIALVLGLSEQETMRRALRVVGRLQATPVRAER